MFLNGTRGLFPFALGKNENTVDKTKKLEVEGNNFIIFHYNCEVLLGSLNIDVTSIPLQSTLQVSRHRECGVIEISN